MTVRQIELTDRWLGQWSRKLFPYGKQRETEGAVVLIDLDGPSGAALAPMTPKDAPAALRFGYPGKLSTSVRGRSGCGSPPGRIRGSCSSGRTCRSSNASRC